MSKSKGNGLDPMDIIDGISAEALVKKRTEKLLQARQKERIERATRKEYPEGIEAHGTDALRFTFCAIATSARSMRFDLKRVDGYRNFCNKLWNAANFVAMNTQILVASPSREESTADRWIRRQFQETSNAVNRAFDDHRFDLAAKHIYEFIWDEFCDWYLELCKPVLSSSDSTDAQKSGTQHCLLETLESILRLAHPLIPFMTEALWQKLPAEFRKGPSIMIAAYPDSIKFDSTADPASGDIEWVKAVVGAVRNIRGEQDIAPSKRIPILLQAGDAEDLRRQQQFALLLDALAKPETMTWISPDAEPPPSAIQIVGALKILVPLAGLIDKSAELERLDKEITKLDKEVQRVNGKLANPAFLANAPPEVVDKERAKVEGYLKQKADFEIQKQRITAI